MNATAQYQADGRMTLGLGVYSRHREPDADRDYPPGFNPFRQHRLDLGEVRASIEELPSPLALLGSRGGMEFANAAAKELFASVPGTATPRSSGVAVLAGSAFAPMLARATAGATAVAFWSVDDARGARCGNLRVAQLGAGSIYQRAWPRAAFVAMIHEFPSRDDGERRLAALADRSGLTPTEQRVLRCLQADSTRRQIAIELGVAHNTVATHIKNIYSKADVHRLTDLMRKL